MILCLHCKRPWAKGTVYCGSCGCSHGKRFCPDGHESPLRANACTTCGSRKLTRAASSLNLRFLTVAVGLFLGHGLVQMVVLPLCAALLHSLYLGALSLLGPLISLAIWSLLLSLFVGDKGRALIWQVWVQGFRLIAAVPKQAIGLVEPSRNLGKAQRTRSPKPGKRQ